MEVGDHVVTSRRFYTHHGVLVGPDRVVHRDKRSRAVVCTTLAEFSRGATVEAVERSASPSEVVRRAISRLGEPGYSPWDNNCEHLVSWCFTGKPVSPQARQWAIVAGLALGLVLVGCAGR